MSFTSSFLDAWRLAGVFPPAPVWPLLLGAAAVLGTLGSAGFVYWRLMHVKDDGGALYTSVSAEPDRPLAKALDSASRRDFIYLVLLLALFGRSNWFLLLAAIGAPTYFCLVLFLAARERSARDARPVRRRRRARARRRRPRLTAGRRRSRGRMTAPHRDCPRRRPSPRPENRRPRRRTNRDGATLRASEGDVQRRSRAPDLRTTESPAT